MSRKSLIVIVVFGLAALVLLGMSMQFALKSSPRLQESIRFKQALARDFASRGVEEVALRNLKKPGHYHLMLTGTLPESDVDRERLDEEVADYFVRTHGNTRAQLLRVSYHTPPSWGCSSALAEPHRVKEFSLPPIRQRLARLEKQRVLAAQLERSGCRLLSCEAIEGTGLEMRVKVGVTDPVEVRRLAQKIERDARARLRGYYSRLRLLLLGKPSPAKDEHGNTVLRDNILFDATYNRQGAKTRRGPGSTSRSRHGEGPGGTR